MKKLLFAVVSFKKGTGIYDIYYIYMHIYCMYGVGVYVSALSNIQIKGVSIEYV